MACFSLYWFEQVCIWIIIAIAVWQVIQLVLPRVTGVLPDLVWQIIRIVLWAVVAIIIVVIIFELLSCLLTSFPFHRVGLIGGPSWLS